jgi:SAM-dependent methyltransferase
MESKLLEAKAGILLDIGCGAHKQSDNWIGIDRLKLPSVDIVHDLEIYPWPLDDESVLTAIASHVVEHIDPAHGGFLKFMDEVWRVLKVGGEFAIVTPYGWSAGYLQDPTHCNPCNEATWAYFDPEAYAGALYTFYRPSPWKIKHLSWIVETNIEVVLVKRPLEDGMNHVV